MKRAQWKSPSCEERSPTGGDPSYVRARRRLWNSPSTESSIPAWVRKAGADGLERWGGGPSRGPRRRWGGCQAKRALPAWAEECSPGLSAGAARPARRRWDTPRVCREPPAWAEVAGDLDESDDEYFDAQGIPQGGYDEEWCAGQVDFAPEGYHPPTLLPSPPLDESPPSLRRRWDPPRTFATEPPSWATRATRVTTRLQTGGRRRWVGHTTPHCQPTWASSNVHWNFVEMPPRNRQRWPITTETPPMLHTWALPRADITELPSDDEC